MSCDYPHTLTGEFIANTLSKPSNSPNVDWRPGSDQYLREWDMADLKRLDLQQFPELLVKPEATQMMKAAPRDDGPSGVSLLPTIDS